MDVMEIIEEIETGNEYMQEGYGLQGKTKQLRTRCEQISIVQYDMSKLGKGIELLLELRRGEFITWIYLDDIETLEVKMMGEGGSIT